MSLPLELLMWLRLRQFRDVYQRSEMIQHMRQFLSGVGQEQAASSLAIDGARYLTPEGFLPLQGDQMEFLNVRKACLELLRWLPAGPLGVPHQLTQDDEYNGYFIPKGTVVNVNIWYGLAQL